MYGFQLIANHGNNNTKKNILNKIGGRLDKARDSGPYTAPCWLWHSTDGGTVTHWGASFIVGAGVAAVVNEFNAGGYPQEMRDAGLSDNQIDTARALLTMSISSVANRGADYEALRVSLGLQNNQCDEYVDL